MIKNKNRNKTLKIKKNNSKDLLEKVVENVWTKKAGKCKELKS